MQKLLCGLLSVFGASSALAQDFNYFIGIENGYVKYANSDFTEKFPASDSNDWGVQVFAGTWIEDQIGLEIGYANLGHQTTEAFLSVNTTDSEYAVDMVYAQALLAQQIDERSKLFLKVGPYYSRVDVEVKNASNDLILFQQRDNNLGVLLGVGVDFAVTDHFGLRIQGQYANDVGTDVVGKADVSLVSFGAQYNF